MINPAISKILFNKTEKEAGELLDQYKCPWRVKFRDGVIVTNLSADRDDRRYNLILENGKVVRVVAG